MKMIYSRKVWFSGWLILLNYLPLCLHFQFHFPFLYFSFLHIPLACLILCLLQQKKNLILCPSSKDNDKNSLTYTLSPRFAVVCLCSRIETICNEKLYLNKMLIYFLIYSFKYFFYYWLKFIINYNYNFFKFLFLI